MGYSRQKIVDLANSWVGKNERDGSYKSIIDIYNSQKTFPRNIKMKYEWAWCACTWSALAIKLGYEKIIPIEISCSQLIKKASKMGIWKEDDMYIPSPGDAILYDWDDNGIGNNNGNPDHVGIVTYVNKSSGYMEIVEGNYSDAVKKRTISINGRYIRGFIAPKYIDGKVDIVKEENNKPNKSIETVAREAIAGKWGNNQERKKNLEAKGYNYDEVQKKINEILNNTSKNTNTTKKIISSTCIARQFDKNLSGVYITTCDLYLRNDAGTNKKALVLIPKNTKVNMYGYYNTHNGAKWYYIQFVINGIRYTGFSHSKYLKKQ